MGNRLWIPFPQVAVQSLLSLRLLPGLSPVENPVQERGYHPPL